MKVTPEELMDLLRLVDITNPEEINCEEFLSRVAGYVERLVAGDVSPDGYESVVHHLKVCPECLEEFRALYAAYREGLA
ncbi:MAG: hypothetical protein AAF517_14010 [Planctomycetota bacterium]